MQGKRVTNITTNDTSLQHKENPNNVRTNKASVAASDLNQQKSHTLETAILIELILNKITNLEGVLSKISERLKKLESDTTKPATNSKHK
jgi:C4-type Zn-finger protein